MSVYKVAQINAISRYRYLLSFSTWVFNSELGRIALTFVLHVQNLNGRLQERALYIADIELLYEQFNKLSSN